MTVETEVVLSEIKHVKNEVNAQGEIVKPAVRYLRFEERQSREDEKANIDEVLSAPKWASPDLTAERRKDLSKRRRDVQKELERSAPKPLSPQAKDEVAALEKVLAARIQEGMPPVEVMRRNPPGAVDAHMRWEKAKKDDILAWKNCRVLLNPDCNEKDLCSIEMLRPSMAMQGGAATFMSDAQISGHFAMTPQARENWPLGEAAVDTALKQAEKHEAEEVARLQKENDDLRKLLKAKKKDGRKTRFALASPAERKAQHEQMEVGRLASQARHDAEAAAAYDAAHPVAKEA